MGCGVLQVEKVRFLICRERAGPEQCNTVYKQSEGAYWQCIWGERSVTGLVSGRYKENHRLCFLVRVLHNKDQHRTLSRVYDKIVRDSQLVTVATRASARGEPTSVLTNENIIKFPVTNYLWDAWRKQLIILQQQNSVTIFSPDPKTVKTKVFSIDMQFLPQLTQIILWFVWIESGLSLAKGAYIWTVA